MDDDYYLGEGDVNFSDDEEIVIAECESQVLRRVGPGEYKLKIDEDGISGVKELKISKDSLESTVRNIKRAREIEEGVAP